MKSLGLYTAPVNVDVVLRLRPDDGVITYVVFLNRYTGSTKKTDTVFHPQETESDAGAGFKTVKATGYELALKAQIRSNGEATMKGEIAIDGKVFPQSFSLPADEAPVVSREWSIIIT
jgi:hypothetical protein